MIQAVASSSTRPSPSSSTINLNARCILSHSQPTTSPSTTSKTTTPSTNDIAAASNTKDLQMSGKPSSSASQGAKSQGQTTEWQQKQQALLAQNQIKVRDFAYESTLPHVATVPYIPPQIQPGPRPLKRGRDEYSSTDDDEHFVQRTWYYDSEIGGCSIRPRDRKKAKPISRKDTEPDISQSQCPMRDIGHSAQSLSNILSQLANGSPSLRSSTPLRTAPASTMYAARGPSPSGEGPSQRSENRIDTPLVTPHGPSQSRVLVRNAEYLTALDGNLKSIASAHPSSQRFSPQLVGSSQTANASKAPTLPFPASTSSPERSPSALARQPSSAIPPPQQSSQRARSKRRKVEVPPVADADAPVPRYHLRSRAPPKTPPRTSPRAQTSRAAAPQRQRVPKGTKGTRTSSRTRKTTKS